LADAISSASPPLIAKPFDEPVSFPPTLAVFSPDGEVFGEPRRALRLSEGETRTFRYGKRVRGLRRRRRGQKSFY